MATLFSFPANTFASDQEAQLVADDDPCDFEVHNGQVALAFDDGPDEEAAVSQAVEMPAEYTGSGLKATIYYYMDSATSGDVRWEVYVEAVTESDAVVLETATSWDSANAVTDTVDATAGELCVVEVTLTNDDSVAAGDSLRIALRRDADHADDDATGDAFVRNVTLEDDG